jgi:hypothetical protein
VVIVCGRGAKAQPQATRAKRCHDRAVKRPEHHGFMNNPNDEASHVSTALSSQTSVAGDTTILPELRWPWHVASACVR